MSPRTPGSGLAVHDGVAVISLLGVVLARPVREPVPRRRPPGRGGARARRRSIVVDFHAEATSEKVALARYLDGRVDRGARHAHARPDERRARARRRHGRDHRRRHDRTARLGDRQRGRRRDPALRRRACRCASSPRREDVRIEGALVECGADGRATSCEPSASRSRVTRRRREHGEAARRARGCARARRRRGGSRSDVAPVAQREPDLGQHERGREQARSRRAPRRPRRAARAGRARAGTAARAPCRTRRTRRRSRRVAEEPVARRRPAREREPEHDERTHLHERERRRRRRRGPAMFCEPCARDDLRMAERRSRSAAPRLSICSGRSAWPRTLAHRPCGARIANGTKIASATPTAPTRAREAPAVAKRPDERERHEHERPELRRDGGAEQRPADASLPCAAAPSSASDEQDVGPQVEAREHERADENRRRARRRTRPAGRCAATTTVSRDAADRHQRTANAVA